MTEYICEYVKFRPHDYEWDGGCEIGIMRKAELIRCKDCKHWGADGYRNGCKYATCIMMENDYCSMAERKEE